MPVSSRHNSQGKIEKPLNPGDIVRIRDEKWYDSLRVVSTDSDGNLEKKVNEHSSTLFTGSMLPFLGKEVMITGVLGEYVIPTYTVKSLYSEDRDIYGMSISSYVFINDMFEEI